MPITFNESSLGLFQDVSGDFVNYSFGCLHGETIIMKCVFVHLLPGLNKSKSSYLRSVLFRCQKKLGQEMLEILHEELKEMRGKWGAPSKTPKETPRF